MLQHTDHAQMVRNVSETPQRYKIADFQLSARQRLLSPEFPGFSTLKLQ